MYEYVTVHVVVASYNYIIRCLTYVLTYLRKLYCRATATRIVRREYPYVLQMLVECTEV